MRTPEDITDDWLEWYTRMFMPEDVDPDNPEVIRAAIEACRMAINAPWQVASVIERYQIIINELSKRLR